jgi:hypothetical protein
MITQAIKNWLHKMFAWWPWKRSNPVEYQHVASAMTSGAAPGTPLWISKDETVPQAGVTPRRFTLDSRAERLAQQRLEAPDTHSLPTAFLQPGADALGGLEEHSPDAPTPRQRLEFLQYLVQRGIVNEGFEDDPPASSS